MAYKVIWKYKGRRRDVYSVNNTGDAFATKQEAEIFRKYLENMR